MCCLTLLIATPLPECASYTSDSTSSLSNLGCNDSKENGTFLKSFINFFKKKQKDQYIRRHYTDPGQGYRERLDTTCFANTRFGSELDKSKSQSEINLTSKSFKDPNIKFTFYPKIQQNNDTSSLTRTPSDTDSVCSIPVNVLRYTTINPSEPIASDSLTSSKQRKKKTVFSIVFDKEADPTEYENDAVFNELLAKRSEKASALRSYVKEKLNEIYKPRKVIRTTICTGQEICSD